MTTWSFETDTEGWSGDGGPVSHAINHAAAGSGSLAVVADFPDPVAVKLFKGFDTRVVRKISYAVRLPGGAPEGVRAVLSFKNKDGLWFQSYGKRLKDIPLLQPGELIPGKWHRFEVDVSRDSTMLEGRGHSARWGRYVAQQMNVMAIKFFCASKARTKIYIDDVRASSVRPEFQPLRITDLSVNTTQPKRFGLYEITFKLNREFDNPFDPEQIRVDAQFEAPDRDELTVPGFFYRRFVRRQRPDKTEELTPVGKGLWKVRFCPIQAGEYRCMIKIAIPGGGDRKVEYLASPLLKFEAVKSQRRGFVRVSKSDPRYFELTTGEFFYPIGHNFRSPNDPRCAKMLKAELPVDRGTFAYDDMLQKMANNGENLFELWMATWWADIEWNAAWPNYQGLGDYNLANAWKIDYLFNKADDLGMYIHLVIDNHGKGSWWVDTEWWSSPYRDVNGGPLHGPAELFTDERAKELYKRKLRYIIARWGYSTRLMGIELWSEVDLTLNRMDFGHRRDPPGHPAHIAWHKEIIPALKAMDPFGHVVTTHYSANFNRIDPGVVALPEVQYVVSDAYRGEYGISSKMTMALIMSRHAKHCRQWRKPTFVTEYGGSPYGASMPQLEADLHSGMWGSYMTTSAGTPLLWWFQFIDRENLYYHFKALNAYHQGEDRRGKDFEMVDADAQAEGVSDEILHTMCLKSKDSAYAWVYDYMQMRLLTDERSAREHKGVSVAVPGFPDGDYNVEIWDTYKGKIIKKLDAKPDDGVVKIDLPNFRRDIALKLKPAR